MPSKDVLRSLYFSTAFVVFDVFVCFPLMQFVRNTEGWTIAHSQIRTISRREMTTNTGNGSPLERKGEVISSASRHNGVKAPSGEICSRASFKF